MNRNGLFALTVVVLGLALAVADLGAAHIAYFPPVLWTTRITCPADGSSSHLAAMDDYEADWYGKQWRAADEGSLYLASLDAHPATRRTWRFTWLRAFHHPVIVRIDETAAGGMRLTAKHLSGEGGYGPGRVDRKIARMLTPDEAARVRTALATTRALDLPAKDCRIGADGSNWILESRGPEGYRYVERWTPESGPVHDFGLTFLRLSGFKLDPLY